MDGITSNEVRLLLQSAALAAAVNSIIITNLNGDIVWCNQAFSRLTGYSPQEALGKNCRILKSGVQDGNFYGSLWKTIVAGRAWKGEITDRRKDGSLYTAEMTITPVSVNDSTFTHYIAIQQDITSRRIAEDRLRLAEEKYRSIVEESPWGMFQATPEGRPLAVNRAMAKLHGYDSAEDLLADVANVSRRLLADPAALRRFAKVLRKDGAEHEAELEILCRDGSRKYISASVRAVFDAQGKVIRHDGVAHDITRRKVAEERTYLLANYDAVTGLANRPFLLEKMGSVLRKAKRHKKKAAVLRLDLDALRKLSGSVGHSVADQLLKKIAVRLNRWTGEKGTAARVGDVSFVLLLPDIGDRAQAAGVAQNVVQSMSKGCSVDGRMLEASCSVGISIFPDDGMDADVLLRHADLAMQSAQDGGGNRYSHFMSKMSAQMVARRDLEAQLQNAVERHEFYLEYQPQADLATGAISGCEALVRWRHPRLGTLFPDKFIPLAESSDLIVSIGEWVLRTTCSQMRQWLNDGVPELSVAVNVSACQFRHDGFVQLVCDVLDEFGLDQRFFEMELTETSMLSFSDAVSMVFPQLKRTGLKLSIDDFGTGFSSLSYLRLLPVYKLKIDQSFIRDVAVDPENSEIVRTILKMAKNLGIRVTAEGVENPRQLSFLRAHNCDEVQGCYVSPLRAPEQY